MRRSAPPGAFSAEHGSRQVEPFTPSRKRKVSPSDTRRKQARQARSLEQAVSDRRDIRSERDPLARRHLPQAERHIDPVELPARDLTRAIRAGAATVDVERAYETKRGAK